MIIRRHGAANMAEPAPAITGRASPHVEVKVANPLWKPYRTGSYLIYDVPAGKKKGSRHFRSAMSSKLPDHRDRASGSHQLNLTDFDHVLGKIVKDHAPSTIYVVDLREETHGFFDLLEGPKRRSDAARGQPGAGADAADGLRRGGGRQRLSRSRDGRAEAQAHGHDGAVPSDPGHRSLRPERHGRRQALRTA